MTRKQHAKRAGEHFWAVQVNDLQQKECRLACAIVDRGQSGAVDKVWARSIDGVRVRLLAPFPLTDAEKGEIRASVGRLNVKQLTRWAMFVAPGWFSDGLSRTDFTRAVWEDKEWWAA